MSAQQLSERCAELGYPIPRSTITNLEIGRKESISIQEVAILAKALGIPPLSLVFPIGRERTVELLPGTEVPTWLAAQWFTGEGPFPAALLDGGWGANTDDMRAWKGGAPLYFRQLRTLREQWDRARGRARQARQEGSSEDVEFTEQMLRDAEDQLRRYRGQMRQMGLDPGDPPAGLSDIENEAQ